jgi:hypothetical protein
MKNLTVSGLLLALLCISASIHLSAQTSTADKLKVKVRISTESAVNDKRIPADLFPVGDNAVMILRNKDGGGGMQSYTKVVPTLELYDRAKLMRTREQEPILKVPAGHLFLENVVWLGDKPVMIAARRDTVQGIVQLYWQYADANLTSAHRPFELLCAFDAKVWGTGKPVPSGSAFRDEFFTAPSQDGSKLLIHSADVVDNDGDARRLMVVVDKAMQVIWQQTLDVEEGSRNLEVQLDNSGDAIALVKRTFKPKEPKKDTTSYSIHLQRINDNGGQDIDMAVSKDRSVKSARLKALADGRMMCAAILHGTDAKGNAIHANYLGHLAAGAEQLTAISTRSFKHDTEDAVYTKGNMRPADILLRKDGGFFVINEYYLETTVADAKLGLSGLRWVHGPLVISSVDAKGAELWSSTFRRVLYTSDHIVGDALGLVYDEQLFLFMLDSEELAEKRKKDEKKFTPQDSKSMYSVYAQFDKEGKTKAKPILRSSGANDYILGSRIWKLGEREYLVLGSSKLGGSRLQPVKIELGE